MRSSRRLGSFVSGCLLALASSLIGTNAGFAADPCGRFSGTWCSQTNGHHGKLCARVRQCDGCTYKVHFTGTFMGAVPFTYSVPMSVTGQGADGSIHLSGQSHLPLFGNFNCTAVVTDCHFVANYSSDKDQGQFQMQRR